MNEYQQAERWVLRGLLRELVSALTVCDHCGNPATKEYRDREGQLIYLSCDLHLRSYPSFSFPDFNELPQAPAIRKIAAYFALEEDAACPSVDATCPHHSYLLGRDGKLFCTDCDSEVGTFEHEEGGMKLHMHARGDYLVPPRAQAWNRS